MDHLPHKLKTPCRFSNCPELTHECYCEKHRKTVNNHYNKYQRDPECNKRYDSRWRKIRKKFIKVHPLCELCKQEGRLNPATVVHHIFELSSGGNHSPENLKSLCAGHHSSIHLKRRNGKHDTS